MSVKIKLAQPVPRAWISRALCAVLRITVIYREDVIERLSMGSCLIACNHVSMLDGVIVAIASPLPLVFLSETHYSRRLWWSRLLFRCLSGLGYGRVLPLDSKSPFGMRQVLKLLERGERLVLFPEGGISVDGNPQDEQRGLAWIVARSGAPVLRVKIEGAHTSRIFAKRGTQWWPKIRLLF